MSEIITELTPEQELLISVYREKWRKIALNTEPIDKNQATAAIKAVYQALNLSEPDISFYDSPLAGLQAGIASQQENIYGELYSYFNNQLWRKSSQLLDRKLVEKLERQLEIPLSLQLFRQFAIHIFNEINISGNPNVQPEMWAISGSHVDFCIEVLKCEYDLKIWELFNNFLKNCGQVYVYENIAIACDRPRILSFDNSYRLHAEATPAIQFADGFSVYAYHGVRLPENYGKLHPHQWQPEWLLSENNAELRRVLIQGIGYARICQELQATELDTWKEYTLLKIDSQVDVEDIYLLKMTCPSTEFIHVLRVPPGIKSAREAIRWVNWGTDPEDFATQS